MRGKPKFGNVLRDVPDDFFSLMLSIMRLHGPKHFNPGSATIKWTTPAIRTANPRKGWEGQVQNGRSSVHLARKTATPTLHRPHKGKYLSKNAAAAFVSDPGEHGFWTKNGSSLILDSVHGDCLDFKTAFLGQEGSGLVHKSWYEAFLMPWRSTETQMGYFWMYCLENPVQGSELTKILLESA